MIKILLKHFIYEKCINVAFDILIRNFSDCKPSNNNYDILVELFENQQKFQRDGHLIPFSAYELPLIKKTFPVLFAKHIDD